MKQNCEKCGRETDIKILIHNTLQKESPNDLNLNQKNVLSAKELFDGKCTFCEQPFLKSLEEDRNNK